MSDFWSKALGLQPAAPAPAPAPAAPTQYQRPFWDTAAPPAYQAAPAQQAPSHPALEEQYQAPLKAKSARLTDSCPDCGSGNYFKPEGQPNMMPVCYTCGYNPRFAHSTAGAGMPSDKSAPVQPSRQVSTANNFNPQTIVATIK